MVSKKQTMNLSISDIIENGSTKDQGLLLFLALQNQFESGNNVKLSLEFCPPMSSSFLNSSFGSLVDRYGYDLIKEKLTFINVQPSKAKVIKNYLDDISKYHK